MTSRERIGRAINWSAIDLIARTGLNFVVLIVLARILAPSDFGLIAMLALFVAVASVLIDSGFGQALIQRQKSTQTDESTIFYFTILMGALIALGLCISAPSIAIFYGQPQLEKMTYWMALNLFINAFSTIHNTLLTKDLNFKIIAIAGASGSTVAGFVAIIMAIQGWGVWSLIGHALTATIITVIMLWILHPWRPLLVFSLHSLRSYFIFGGFLLWTGVLRTLYTNLYALMIGKLHTVQDVGFYSQARRLQLLPVSIISTIIGRVTFPLFAAASDDKAKLVRGLRKALTHLMFINIPLMLSIMMLSEDLVLTLFGEKWLPSVPVLQVLAISGLVFPLHVLNLNVLLARGHSGLNARIQLIKLTIGISLLLMTSPYGIVAIAYGQLTTSFLGILINTHYTKKHLDYGAIAQLRDVSPYMLASIPMILIISVISWFSNMSHHIELLVAASAGLSTYLIVCRIAKLKALESLVSLTLRRTI